TALTTFLRRPEIARPGAMQAESKRAHGLVALAERVAKGLIHYPPYMWLVALLARIELYFYPYIAVNALYAARAFAMVALRFARRGEKVESSRAIRAIEAVHAPVARGPP